MERTVAVVEHMLPLLGSPVHRTRLLVAVGVELEQHQGGEVDQHVIRAVLEESHRILDESIRALSVELSQRTGLSPAALRTRPGWNAALALDGHGEERLAGIEDLPGTLVVLTVRELLSRTAARRSTQSRGRYEELGDLWSSTRVTGRNFDAVIDAAGEHREETSRIGWALIGLEGRRHVNLIWHQANKLQRSFPDREASELLTWGWLGLRTALRNYNPGLGFAFSTYAVTRIVGAIRDGVRSENPVPKRLGTLARKVAGVESELTQALGRAPTMKEIGDAVEVEVAQLSILRRTRAAASIEEIIAGVDRSGGNEPEWLAGGSDTALSALDQVSAEVIAEAMAALPLEEAEAVRLLILEDRSPTEARIAAGVTARQLRQRKERALASLRESLAGLDPDAG